MTVPAPPFPKGRPRSYVRHWFAEDGHSDEDATGWYVISVDSDGVPWDAMGPYDSEEFATAMLGGDADDSRRTNPRRREAR